MEKGCRSSRRVFDTVTALSRRRVMVVNGTAFGYPIFFGSAKAVSLRGSWMVIMNAFPALDHLFRIVTMSNRIQLNINGMDVSVEAEEERSLLSILRDELDLTGAKYGCGEGQCGACTVLLDDKPTRSCITTLADVAGRHITTIEGLEQNGTLHPLQEAFVEVGAMQCAYCTSGMIMSGVGLLREKPHPTHEEILHHMNGNICRCGTYQRIIAAISKAATQEAAR